DDVRVQAERGERTFAPGDRIMFLKNDRDMGVKNGTLGTVSQVSEQAMTVRTDAGRSVSFDTSTYNQVDHGYAATIHKAQGMTVDRAHVLATPGLDRHGSYVALSRHRNSVDLHFGRDDFRDDGRLARTMGRDRAKDMATDYQPARDYAERRGITWRERVEKVVEKVRGIFDNFRPSRTVEPGPEAAASRPAPAPAREIPTDKAMARDTAIRRHARAVVRIWDMRERELPVLPHQKTELQKARHDIDGYGKSVARDMEAAYRGDPALARETAAGGATAPAIQAMRGEREIRVGHERRADEWIEKFKGLDRQSARQIDAGNYAGHERSRSVMSDMTKSLHRDPQLESLIAIRARELGLKMEMAQSAGNGGIGRELASLYRLEWQRSRGLGL
ncbi:MAG: Ti-type conjugative transfer relaxase TraA, partial [Gemmobacter sp.]|nr:Ti-type conjugative transfer relaxase TraA [Gemmobacter sp.]